MRRALAIDEKSFGPDHPNVATALNNLGRLLQATNRLAEAEPLMRRALAIDEKSFGPEHPERRHQAQQPGLAAEGHQPAAEAEPLMRRALAIDEKSSWPEHPNVANSLNNLAALLQATNRLADAEPLMRRALAIDEKSFGPDHPDVATKLNNLAVLLQDTNRLAEAEPLYRRALAIDEKSFGARASQCCQQTSTTWPSCCRPPTGWPRPSRLMRRALAIDEKSFGPEHPNVATALNNLAELLQDTNRLAEAEPLYAPRARHRREELGPRSSQRRYAHSTTWPAAAGHQPARRGRAVDAPRARHRSRKLRRPIIPTLPSALNNLARCCRPPTGWPRPSR